eukprot:m.56197 g.56197  ORF g.56197 m.56197 type:complete len:810 (-) comp7660_c0_seq1:75-2504(-)
MPRYVMTIDDKDPVPTESGSSENESDGEVIAPSATSTAVRRKRTGKQRAVGAAAAAAVGDGTDGSGDVESGFFDDLEDDPLMSRKGPVTTTWHERGAESSDLSAHGRLSNVDRKIAEHLETQPGGIETFKDKGDVDGTSEGAGGASAMGRVRSVNASDTASRRDDEGHESEAESDDGSEGDSDDEEAEERKRNFFADAPEDTTPTTSFAEMELSRPLLRAITSLGFETPSLVQQRAIPIALMGRDLCACATTGSGKTAAFMLPVLERLLFRPKKIAQTRVLVLSPTRELAVQVYDMSKKLAQFTDVTFGLAVGGMALRPQEAELRARPDVVVATPGRLVDHITNTFSFSLDGIEIVIMDEADRLLEVGFKDELDRIVQSCPRSRQTMLFSATMTDAVEDLVELSLHEPVRLFVNINTQVTSNLTQEFIRIRKNREHCREGIVLALCSRVYKRRCMVFVRSKVQAHRLRVVFGLAGLQVAELHGGLSQTQRLNSLAMFTQQKVDFLITTDLAGRGIDVPGVEAVINLTMPHTLKQYIHRVGRTARAGTQGRSVTLVGEAERKILRQIVKGGEGNLKSRVVAPRVVEHFQKKIKSMEGSIKHVLEEEKADAEIDRAEMEVTKAQNLIEHRDEILARAPRQWIVSGKEKTDAAKLSRAVHVGEADDIESASNTVATNRKNGLSKTAKKKRKRAAEREDPSLAAAAAISRAAKRTRRPKKINVFTPERTTNAGSGKKKQKKIQGFETEIKRGQRKQTADGAGAGKPRNAPRPRNKTKAGGSTGGGSTGAPKHKGGSGGGGGGSFKSKSKHKRR